MKREIVIAIGLVSCEKVIGELDTDDYDDDLTEFELEDQMYTDAYDIASEHFEVWLK